MGDARSAETPPEVEFGGADWGMPPWARGAPLPAFTHIDGRNVVLVDAGEYRALLALQDAVVHLSFGGSPADLTASVAAQASTAESDDTRTCVRCQRGA